MDAYVTPAHAGTHPERPHGFHGEEEEDHHEKKPVPVLKKVKDKVKKIKNTISKKTHGHDTNSSEEDEYEEEADPEVHGAPIYESAAAGNLEMGSAEIRQPGRVGLGTIVGHDVEGRSDPTQLSHPSADDHTFLGRSEKPVGEPGALGKIAGRVEEDPAAPNSRSRTSAPSDHTQLLSSTGTGSDVVGESPIIRSFENMTVSDKPQAEKVVLQSPPTGTHDQFSPPNPPQRSEERPEETVQDTKTPTFTEKIVSPAAAVKDSAAATPTYTEKIVSTAAAAKDAAASAASTVYNKVSEAGTAVVGKAQQPQGAPASTASVKGYLSEKLRPGEEDRALSEVISDAMHAKRPTEGESRAAEGEGGKGMVEKIKSAVTSLLGAGMVSGNRVPPVTDDRAESEGRAEQMGDAVLHEEDVKHSG